MSHQDYEKISGFQVDTVVVQPNQTNLSAYSYRGGSQIKKIFEWTVKFIPIVCNMLGHM